MRIKLIVEYDGTAYSGWQMQDNARTVQGEVEHALKLLTGENIVVFSAGRTDKGVNAMGMAVHFDIDCTIPTEKFALILNNVLPPDIRAISSEQVHNEFHARYSAKGKQYVYKIYNAANASAIYRNTTMHIPVPLNIKAMKQAAKYFEGTQDFAAFCATGSKVKSTVRTVSSVEIDEQLPIISISVTGNGFLYNMVRIMAGTLIDVGKGKLKPEQIPEIIKSLDRTKAGITAEPQGLTLMKVFY